MVLIISQTQFFSFHLFHLSKLSTFHATHQFWTYLYSHLKWACLSLYQCSYLLLRYHRQWQSRRSFWKRRQAFESRSARQVLHWLLVSLVYVRLNSSAVRLVAMGAAQGFPLDRGVFKTREIGLCKMLSTKVHQGVYLSIAMASSRPVSSPPPWPLWLLQRCRS